MTNVQTHKTQNCVIGMCCHHCAMINTCISGVNTYKVLCSNCVCQAVSSKQFHLLTRYIADQNSFRLLFEFFLSSFYLLCYCSIRGFFLTLFQQSIIKWTNLDQVRLLQVSFQETVLIVKTHIKGEFPNSIRANNKNNISFK